ncbi:MAG: hypothetical protein AAGK32_01025, partial [Actinomycetota bacterium]
MSVRFSRLVGTALMALILLAAGCSGDDSGGGAGADTSSSTTTTTAPAAGTAATPDAAGELAVGDTPDSLGPLRGPFPKHIDVWGVAVVGTSATPDAAMVHAATVLAEYLDNDEDGEPDDPDVVSAMVSNRATLLMAATPEELEEVGTDQVFDFVGPGGQDLYASEVLPDGGFDAHPLFNTRWWTSS